MNSELLTLEQARQRLQQQDRVLLLCHKNPDGDTIGSAAALYHALKMLGKTAAVACSDPIPARYDYMQIGMYKGDFEPGYIVALDVAGLQLFGDGTIAWAQKCGLCIDHHATHSRYADGLVLDGTAAATAEIMFSLLENMPGVELNTCIADCLYTGLATDTGCFRFGNTTARTHEVAAELMLRGADIRRLNELLFESKSRSRLSIEGVAVRNLEYFFDGRCAMTAITRGEIEDCGASEEDLEGVAGIARAIEGVEVGVTLRQQPTGSYKVSIRTSTAVDASAIASRLGGGGHRGAAGCEIIGGLENAKQAMLAEVARELGVPKP